MEKLGICFSFVLLHATHSETVPKCPNGYDGLLEADLYLKAQPIDSDDLKWLKTQIRAHTDAAPTSGVNHQDESNTASILRHSKSTHR
jgi:hypothetical protein